MHFSKLEKQVTFAIASLFGIRLLGLFMVLPLLSIYLYHLKNYTTTQIGLAMGIYGLTQALFQLPLGMLSDYYPRRHIIALGLILFTLGSLLVGLSENISWIILGRALQGAGAIGSATLALVADFTSVENRPTAMAIIGAVIGLSFFGGILIGPLLHTWYSIPVLFIISAGLGLICLIILYTQIPSFKQSFTLSFKWSTIPPLLINKKLCRINIRIFLLHMIFIISFINIPFILSHFFKSTEYIRFYLPVFLIALFLVFSCLKYYRKYIEGLVFYNETALIFIQICFAFTHTHLLLFAINVCLFIAAFTLLEATLPSLMTQYAPAEHKGLASGIFSSFQFLGIFIGSIIGSWIYYHTHFIYNFYLNAILISIAWIMHFL